MQTIEPSSTSAVDQGQRDELDQLIARRFEELWQAKRQEEQAGPKKMAIIATRGTLDWAYPPLILATAAASLGWEVGIFFTFYGLSILQKPDRRKLQVAPVGNPAMPMPLPIPQLVAAIPGMTSVATTMMKAKFKSHGVATIDELLELAVDAGVRLMPCGMTAQVFGYTQDQFLDAAEPMCGAAAFIDYAQDADISLFT